MKKIIIYSVIALLVIVFGVIVINYLSNPLRKSEEQIRKNILEITPIGMSMEDVIRVIGTKEKWVIRYTFDFGYVMKMGFPSEPDSSDFAEGKVIGEKSIRGTIGEYQNFFKVYVETYWAFDENSKLIDIAVKKDSNSF